MPTLFQGDAANAARGFEDEIMVRCPAHQMALAFRSAMELIEPKDQAGRAALWHRHTRPRPVRSQVEHKMFKVRRISGFLFRNQALPGWIVDVAIVDELLHFK
jgi:hypothetical protein